MQLDEPLNAIARLGRDLRRLGGRRQPGDEVQLAPARERDDASEVHLAQLDRRARERAHDRGGIPRIDEQAHPGQHISNLGPLEKLRRALLAGGC